MRSFSRKKHAAFLRPPPVSSRASSRETSMRIPKLSCSSDTAAPCRQNDATLMMTSECQKRAGETA